MKDLSTVTNIVNDIHPGVLVREVPKISSSHRHCLRGQLLAAVSSLGVLKVQQGGLYLRLGTQSKARTHKTTICIINNNTNLLFVQVVSLIEESRLARSREKRAGVWRPQYSRPERREAGVCKQVVVMLSNVIQPKCTQ